MKSNIMVDLNNRHLIEKNFHRRDTSSLELALPNESKVYFLPLPSFKLKKRVMVLQLVEPWSLWIHKWDVFRNEERNEVIQMTGKVMVLRPDGLLFCVLDWLTNSSTNILLVLCIQSCSINNSLLQI